MKFLVENLSPAQVLSLPIGAAKEYTADEMALIADSVAQVMQPVAQFLSTGTNSLGQPVSVPTMRPAPQKVRCYVIEDDGKRQEMTAADLGSLFAEQIKARQEKRVSDHKAREAKRAERFMR